MTRFLFSGLLVCPSDWTKEKCAEYLTRILPTEEERGRLIVEEELSPLITKPISPAAIMKEAIRQEEERQAAARARAFGSEAGAAGEALRRIAERMGEKRLKPLICECTHSQLAHNFGACSSVGCKCEEFKRAGGLPTLGSPAKTGDDGHGSGPLACPCWVTGKYVWVPGCAGHPRESMT